MESLMIEMNKSKKQSLVAFYFYKYKLENYASIVKKTTGEILSFCKFFSFSLYYFINSE